MLRTHRTVLQLAVCQALSMSCMSLLISTSPLVGAQLAPSPALSTLPFGLQLIATTLCALPISLFMQRHGRRAGFLLGIVLGIAGGGVAVTAVWLQSFWLFCAGVALAGGFAASSLYYRFAAGEAAEPEFRERATSWVLAGGVIAAFLGPQIAKLTRELLPVPMAGPFLALVGLPLLSALMLSTLRLPPPAAAPQGDERLPLRTLVGRPPVLAAIICGVAAYSTMGFVMTATPLAMTSCGFDFNDSASVIQWHVLAMFAPSFFTGHLVKRFGLPRLMGAGILLTAGCTAVALTGIDFAHFAAGLVLLGVGWNFLYVGATILLGQSLAPHERGRIQGLNEFAVFGTTAAGSFAAGALHAAVGWNAVTLAILPMLLLAAAALLLWRLPRRQPA